MKSKLLIFTILVSLFFACSKDKFQTKPQLKLKSLSTNVVAPAGNLRVLLECTDKEGDVDDSILVVRQRLNKKGLLTLPPSPYKIPEFPNTSTAEFEITLNYQFGLVFGIPPIRIPGTIGNLNEPDTLNLKIVARDKAGNKSDTLLISNIVVIR